MQSGSRSSYAQLLFHDKQAISLRKWPCCGSKHFQTLLPYLGSGLHFDQAWFRCCRVKCEARGLVMRICHGTKIALATLWQSVGGALETHKTCSEQEQVTGISSIREVKMSLATYRCASISSSLSRKTVSQRA